MAGIVDRVEFEWITNYFPTHQQIEEEQDRRGYNHWGYDGPFNIQTTPVITLLGDNDSVEYKTTWYCFASAD